MRHALLGKTWFLVTCEPYYNYGILISTFTYFISLDHHDQIIISNLGFADNGAAYLLFH